MTGEISVREQQPAKRATLHLFCFLRVLDFVRTDHGLAALVPTESASKRRGWLKDWRQVIGSALGFCRRTIMPFNWPEWLYARSELHAQTAMPETSNCVEDYRIVMNCSIEVGGTLWFILCFDARMDIAYLEAIRSAQ